MAFTAIRPDLGFSKGREVSLFNVAALLGFGDRCDELGRAAGFEWKTKNWGEPQYVNRTY